MASIDTGNVLYAPAIPVGIVDLDKLQQVVKTPKERKGSKTEWEVSFIIDSEKYSTRHSSEAGAQAMIDVMIAAISEPLDTSDGLFAPYKDIGVLNGPALSRASEVTREFITVYRWGLEVQIGKTKLNFLSLTEAGATQLQTEIVEILAESRNR